MPFFSATLKNRTLSLPTFLTPAWSSLEVEHHPEQRPASPPGDGTLPTASADTKDQGGAK